uniref:C-type lectin domain-containing protein n=1 Tax=Labrus bergylta TaxID=56723 RepID=A0A3Q3ME21_9LABR
MDSGCNKWHDASSWYYVPFFCYKVFVVRERKTWVEALDYCREHHKDLASVASEAEMTLIWGELDKNETSDHVWIGLRFFPGRLWLWTDGQPTDYQAWNREEKPSCVAPIDMHLCWNQVPDTSSWTCRRGQVGLSLMGRCFKAAQKLVELSFLLRAE